MAKKKKPLGIIKCVVCGKEFKQIRGNQVTCSIECRRKRDSELQKQWREKNPNLVGNIRDYTDILHLVVLSNLEVLNANMIENNIKQNRKAMHLK